MPVPSKRTLAIIATAVSAAAPAGAAARIDKGVDVVPNGGVPAHVQAFLAPAPSAADGFQWGDAGIGAGGVLALFGAAGATVAVSRQRRGRQLG